MIAKIHTLLYQREETHLLRNVAVAYGRKLISILSVNSNNLKIKENDDDELKKKETRCRQK